MTTRLHIQNQRQVVIPARFARAVTGAPVIDAPDLDDRGYVLHRPAGWNSTPTRGPMIGMTVGDTVRLKVVREDIASTAPLFATVSAAANPQVEVVDPPAGTAIAASGEVKLRAVANTTSGQALEIRFGSATGPIVAMLEPHVFSPRTFHITPHVCTVHSAAAAPGTGSAPTVGGAALDVGRVFDLVRAIWRTSALDLDVAAPVPGAFFGFPRDNFTPLTNGTAAGTLGAMINQSFVANTCNVYFVPFSDGPLGIGINRESRFIMGWSRPACIIWVNGVMNAGTGAVTFRRSGSNASIYHELGNDTAHEIGHFLTLPHADLHNGDDARPDTYCRRMLMHPNNLLPQAAAPVVNAADNNDVRFDDIGYGLGGGGLGHRGCLVTMKNFPTHQSDGETHRVRARFSSANLY